jgi:hypothetical protein
MFSNLIAQSFTVQAVSGLVGTNHIIMIVHDLDAGDGL